MSIVSFYPEAAKSQIDSVNLFQMISLFQEMRRVIGAAAALGILICCTLAILSKIIDQPKKMITAFFTDYGDYLGWGTLGLGVIPIFCYLLDEQHQEFWPQHHQDQPHQALNLRRRYG